ncbi:hypothetical protein MVEN_01177400 [Mycena venus]|uniref:Uncharacterized protein n=1 Tax=Mycena venus TaxID=2733690 RepID=A0A8H6Y3R7_9AGAR|nr:hypothetical protein MVEN_01177400 [Mycena venus]
MASGNPKYYAAAIFAPAVMLAFPILVSGNCYEAFFSLRVGSSDSLVGGMDNRGNPVNIRNATAMAYGLCLETCGGGTWDIGGGWSRFQTFGGNLGTWLFPFLALLSQVPLEGDTILENLMSIFLIIGSPTLAAYSIALTAFNSRWVHRRFSSISYPNAHTAGWILDNFQQSPLRVTGNDLLLGSLIVLPENDQWWSELITFLNSKHHYTWTFSNITSIIWVVFSFFLAAMASLAGKFLFLGCDFSDASLNTQQGLGLAFCWIWLLPILICSLSNAPRCNKTSLHDALRRANQHVYVAAYSGNPVPAHFTVNRPPFSLDIHDGHLRMDHQRGARIYNYDRLMTWSLAVERVYASFQAASSREKRQLPVNSSTGWTKNRKGVLAPSNRRGSPAQVAEYIQAGDHKILPPDLGWRSFNSSMLAVFLTWATIGPAAVLDFALPTKGLGCKSGTRLIYGLFSTVVWAMLVASTRLRYNSINSRPQHKTTNGSLSDQYAKVLSGTAKILACINALWIITSNFLECAGVYDSLLVQFRCALLGLSRLCCHDSNVDGCA